ncbi:hypothetical protein GGI21_005891, partial [Coemansia aciculifera]
MTCIRVNTVSLATFIKLADDGKALSCTTADLQQDLNLESDTAFDDAECISGDDDDNDNALVAVPAPAQAIDIPGALDEKKKRDQSGPLRLERRVSFNLRENTTIQFPSNATIGKIAQACSKRRASLVESSSGGGKSYEELAQMADRKAQALLPRGASSELFRVDDGFAMTALYVKRGHIRLLDHGAAEDVRARPVKGVLKPFTPPIAATSSSSSSSSALADAVGVAVAPLSGAGVG